MALRCLPQLYDYFLVLDFEATCDRMPTIPVQEIIEFPVAKLNAETLEVESTFHYYVRPTICPELTSFCTELTGIIQGMVDNQLTIDVVLTKFDEWLKNEDLHNKRFTFVTCGDWDLKKMLPSETTAKGIHIPDYFNGWINVKKAFCDHTRRFPRGIKDMLQYLHIVHEVMRWGGDG